MNRILLLILVASGCPQGTEGKDAQGSFTPDGDDDDTTATPFCGDGWVDAGEACDDGNDEDTDGCTQGCEDAACGDGFVQPVNREDCDDANGDDTDACPSSCLDAACGDGFVQYGVEPCDDGDDDDTDLCTQVCEPAACGDGHTQPGVGESCDDGGTVPQDGCSATCQVEVAAAFVYAGDLADSIDLVTVATASTAPFYEGPSSGAPQDVMNGLALSADGVTLWFSSQSEGLSGDGAIWSMPAAGGVEPTLFDDLDPSGDPFYASGLAVGPDGLLYAMIQPLRVLRYDDVTDGTSDVVVYDPGGNTGSGWGLAISSAGDPFFVDRDANTVERVTGAATTEVWATEADGLVDPQEIALDAFGALYVADVATGIWRFTAPNTGELLADADEGVISPSAIEVDPANGDLYVANTCGLQTSTIVRLASDGTPIPPSPLADGYDALVCSSSLALAR